MEEPDRAFPHEEGRGTPIPPPLYFIEQGNGGGL